MRYLISVAYDGSKFYGFQRIPHKKTVQGELERALTKINKTKVVVKGAGRTDRGVHAIDQKVHFDLNVKVPEERLVNAINSLVGPYIEVHDAHAVDDDFHARFDVKKKTYTYIVNLGYASPLVQDYTYNYNRELDVKKMRRASRVLLGCHSYQAFTSGERESYNSIIHNIKITRRRDFLYITFIGKSFYRYMVRNLVGALFLVGEGKIGAHELEEMLDKRENIYHYLTVPASGLYLEKIEY